METCDVLIVGGGVIGASAAWHLASRGCRGVRVLERGAAPGAGSTGKATGGFRAQFASDVNVRLSLLSREKLLRFADEVGGDPGFRPHGYLFMAERPETLDALLDAQAVQHAAGATDGRRVSVDEIRAINPAVEVGGIVGGVFSPSDGFIRPMQILAGYTDAARRLGARFDYGVSVDGFRVEDGRITSVLTSAGEIAPGVVINAAGAWAGAVARMAGVEIPVAPLRRQVALTTPFAALPGEMPLTILVEDGFHARMRDGRAMLLWPDEPESADAFDCAFHEPWLAEVTRRAHHWLPCLRNAEIDRAACYAGLYEMSPDRHVLLGAAPGIANLLLANGSSGHGVMHSPALGHLLAELILDGRASSIDVHPLRPSRFAEGEPIASGEFL